jgi:hypothetical protein
VKIDKSPPALLQPPSEQAMVYLVEDDTEFESTPKPTTRIGVDGTWVGANHGNSYFSLAVAPGVHDLCWSWQSLAVIGAHDTSAAARFTAEAGQMYYFRVKNKWLREHAASQVDLSPVGSDQGQLLASRRPLSVSHRKQSLLFEGQSCPLRLPTAGKTAEGHRLGNLSGFFQLGLLNS